jgi:hypothetical protein
LSVGFFFPFPLPSTSIDDDGAPGTSTAEFFQKPCSLNAGELHIEDEELSEIVSKKGLRLFDIGAVDNAILLRIQCCANGFRKVRMLREH